MNTIKFMKKKNKLVKKVTGLIMIPKDQIIYEPKVKLNESSDCSELLAMICPYCIARDTGDSILNCKTCPMAKADNNCNENGSTWVKAHEVWKKKSTPKDHKKMRKLVKKYNKGQ